MFSGMMISATTPNNKIWFLIFFVFMMICVVGQLITKEKQKERIEKLEKKIEELVGEDK
jgi:hypothetical protein